MKKYALVCSTAAEAERFRKTMFGSLHDYEKSDFYIGFVRQRWEGFRFEHVFLRPSAEYHLLNLPQSGREAFFQSLNMRLSSGGSIIRGW